MTDRILWKYKIHQNNRERKKFHMRAFYYFLEHFCVYSKNADGQFGAVKIGCYRQKKWKYILNAHTISVAHSAHIEATGVQISFSVQTGTEEPQESVIAGGCTHGTHTHSQLTRISTFGSFHSNFQFCPRNLLNKM